MAMQQQQQQQLYQQQYQQQYHHHHQLAYPQHQQHVQHQQPPAHPFFPGIGPMAYAGGYQQMMAEPGYPAPMMAADRPYAMLPDQSYPHLHSDLHSDAEAIAAAAGASTHGWEPQIATPPKPRAENTQGSPGSAGGRGGVQNLPIGRLVAMAKEQEGSRALQRALTGMSSSRLQAACDELGPHLGELATSLFGNYLVSSMASLPEAQPWLEKALKGRVVELMTHAQGSRVVQAAMHALPTRAVHTLVNELVGEVANTSRSVNGSWSVCAAFKATRAPFIVAEIAASIRTLATQQSGSRAVQKILPEASSNDVDTRCVVAALTACGTDELARLAVDQYGNYVVQIALRISASEPSERSTLVAMLLPSLTRLATSKSGSNVAEALIACATMEQLLKMKALLHGSGVELAGHCFGKHVIAALSRRLN